MNLFKKIFGSKENQTLKTDSVNEKNVPKTVNLPLGKIEPIVNQKSELLKTDSNIEKNETCTFTDIRNGKTYKTIKIGKQTWMAENLDVDTFQNGEPIPNLKTNEAWFNSGINEKPACCNYDNDPIENRRKYGKLYNWYAVNDPRGLAPKGYRIPSKKDFDELLLNFGGEGKNAFQALVEDNNIGFFALPGGWCNEGGYFECIELGGRYWSSSEDGIGSSRMVVGFTFKDIKLTNAQRQMGFSVRCLQE